MGRLNEAVKYRAPETNKSSLFRLPRHSFLSFLTGDYGGAMGLI